MSPARVYLMPPFFHVPAEIKICIRQRGSMSAVKRLNRALMDERVYPHNPKTTDGIDRLLAAINGTDIEKAA